MQIRYETLQVGSFDFLRSIHIVRMVPEALTQKFFDLRSGDNKMCLGSSKIHEYKRFGKEIISEMVQKAKSWKFENHKSEVGVPLVNQKYYF